MRLELRDSFQVISKFLLLVYLVRLILVSLFLFFLVSIVSQEFFKSVLQNNNIGRGI